MSRVVTLLIALLALHLMLGALSWVVGRGQQKSSALRWWGAGLLAYAAGLAWVVSGAFAWRAVAVTGGNTLIAVSSVMCTLGVLSHTRVRLHRRWIGACLGALAAILAWNNFGANPDHGINIAAPTVIGIAMFSTAAIAIFQRGPAESLTANRFLSAILIAATILWIVRVGAFYGMRGRSGDTQALDDMTSLFAIAQMLIGVAATLALFWIDVRLMQAELSRVAHTDALTGLPNRRSIVASFEQARSVASRDGSRLGVILLDLDRFKEVNDAHGHTVGDRILRLAARTLASACRSDDVLGRIGGEEFMVLVPCERDDGAVAAAERLRRAIGAEALDAGDRRLTVTASGGVAIFPDDGGDWDTLFGVADRRLYSAKTAGRDRVVAEG